MKTFNKISRAPLAWLGVLALLLVLAISFKFTVKAQDVASASPAVEWQDTDIGATVLAGSAQLDSDGGYIVSSTGGDISGTSDSFNYLYQTLNGNGEVITRILGVQGGNGLTKAGLMLRETLDAGGVNAMISVKLSGEASFQWRSSVGGNTGRTLANAGMIVPGWLKIVRNGDWVGGYSSPDGINWTLTGWETIDGLATQVSVGLALNGGGVISRASFGQISLSQVNPADVLTPSVGAGDGLMGSYYSNRHLFGNPVMSRVDQGIDCDYQYLSSQGSNDVTYCTNDCLTALGMSKGDEYGVRWTGELQAQFNEPYTIYAGTDDGMRVWINENLVIDDWMGHSKRESSVTTNLVAGQKYLIRVEWFQNYGASKMSLSWSSPSTPKRIIPRDQLYSQPTDADGNGLPDRWERHYFGQIGANPGADVDGDGWSNSQKYSRHISPVNPMNWGVPNAWTHCDVDNRTHRDASDGSAAYSNGVFTVSSLGRDVWERVDDFHYVYQALGTNGEIVARISGLNGVNPEGMAGLMLRETQDKDSRNVFLAYGQDNILFFQSRTATGDNTVRNHSVTNQAAPGWLKLVRNNDWIGGYVSTNGTNWSLFDWEMIGGLPAQAYVGLAVTAHSHKGMRSPTTAQFDQVKLSPADPSEVLNPVEGNGDGLLASYRNDSLQYLPGLTNLVDEQIYFNWIHNPPVKILDPNSYGICWSGEVQAQFAEPYTFSLQCRQEDWVRVWINEELIIDGWRTLHPDTIFKGTVNLMAGQDYLIRVEMFNNHGRGMARLKWESPSTPKHIVPQSQLYSQPTDSDGNGLPDLWELHYFGHIGVDPNADPDGDGLSNIQEYRYHTNPTKADTDNDGMPDGWEVSHGLDPQFNDAGADYDNSGWSNLQKYAAGLDPYNLDANGDGLPDAFEAQYLGLDVSTSHANLTSVAAVANGAQATNFLGRWQVDGNDIFALDRRGGLDFNLPVKNADKYVLNLIGTQNQFNPLETSFKLLLAIDGQTLGHYTLNAGYGTNGEVALVLPYLKAGPHTLRVFWDGVADHSSLRIKQVKLLAVSGADSNHNGIKDWVENMVSLEAGLDQTNKTIGSYTSPICLEGRDAYPTLASLTNTPVRHLVARGHDRWPLVCQRPAANLSNCFFSELPEWGLDRDPKITMVADQLVGLAGRYHHPPRRQFVTYRPAHQWGQR